MNYSITKHGKSQQVIMPASWQAIAEEVGSPTIRKLTYHKYINTKIVAALNQLHQNELATTIYQCGTWAEISIDSKNREHITRANFCRQRLCQVCAWRRSARFFAEMLPVLHAVKSRGYKFIFVTLTVKNCTSDDAPAAVDTLLRAWDRLLKRRQYKTAWQGFIRSVEVTYNTKSNSYHPHIHAMIAVKPSYGSKNDKSYISQSQIVTDWQTALNVDYKPIVWVQSVRDKKNSNKDNTIGGALETMKYAFKVSFKTISTDTVATIQMALRQRRLISFGGIIAKVRKEIAEQEDQLTDTPVDDEIAKVLYRFHPDGWEVTEDEKNTYTVDNELQQLSL